MEEVDKEISEMKLSLNSRARIVAESYLVAVRLFLLCLLHFVSFSFFEVQHLTCLIITFMPCIMTTITSLDLSSIALLHLPWLRRLIKNGNARQCIHGHVGHCVGCSTCAFDSSNIHPATSKTFLLKWHLYFRFAKLRIL